MSITMILYLLAFVFFVLGFLGVSRPPLSWRDGGYACLVLSLIIR
jgi:hypothetical protein